MRHNETAFAAVKREINEELGVDIFPYQKIRSFIYPYPFGKVRLFLIKCSISEEARQQLAQQSRTEYKWTYILNTANIDFAPLDKRIITFLLKDNSVITKKTKGPGFAAMSAETRKLITSRGGKSAQARGKSHRWTKEEASLAGKIGGRKSKRRKTRFPK